MRTTPRSSAFFILIFSMFYVEKFFSAIYSKLIRKKNINLIDRAL